MRGERLGTGIGPNNAPKNDNVVTERWSSPTLTILLGTGHGRPTAATAPDCHATRYWHSEHPTVWSGDMTIQRMDNVLIVVDDLEAAKSFFIELGLELEGETQVEGPSVDSLIGLKDVRATLALMRTPDGHGRIELDKFHTPNAIRFGPVDAPVNALGIRRIMFAVEDIDVVVARLRAHGAELIGEVVQYEDTNRLAYIRGPEGIIIGLNEQLS